MKINIKDLREGDVIIFNNLGGRYNSNKIAQFLGVPNEDSCYYNAPESYEITFIKLVNIGRHNIKDAILGKAHIKDKLYYYGISVENDHYISYIENIRKKASINILTII